MKRYWVAILYFAAFAAVLTAAFLGTTHERRWCDRACNLSQCGCVETCPHER